MLHDLIDRIVERLAIADICLHHQGMMACRTQLACETLGVF